MIALDDFYKLLEKLICGKVSNEEFDNQRRKLLKGIASTALGSLSPVSAAAINQLADSGETNVKLDFDYKSMLDIRLEDFIHQLFLISIGKSCASKVSQLDFDDSNNSSEISAYIKTVEDCKKSISPRDMKYILDEESIAMSYNNITNLISTIFSEFRGRDKTKPGSKLVDESNFSEFKEGLAKYLSSNDFLEYCKSEVAIYTRGIFKTLGFAPVNITPSFIRDLCLLNTKETFAAQHQQWLKEANDSLNQATETIAKNYKPYKAMNEFKVDDEWFKKNCFVTPLISTRVPNTHADNEAVNAQPNIRYYRVKFSGVPKECLNDPITLPYITSSVYPHISHICRGKGKIEKVSTLRYSKHLTYTLALDSSYCQKEIETLNNMARNNPSTRHR